MDKGFYMISKNFSFEAAHKLFGLKEGHKCMQDHGHSYHVEVFLIAKELNNHGFVVDYGDLEPIKKYIDENLDHHNLNDVLPMATTAENIAKFLFDKFKILFPELCAVEVRETEKTSARYMEV